MSAKNIYLDMKNFKKREKLKNKLNLKNDLWINLLLVLKKHNRKFG